MFGSLRSRCARISSASQLRFELLDERTVLSAMSPVGDVAREVEPVAVPLVANSPPTGLDGEAFMQGTSYTFSIGDFGFSDAGNSPPANLSGVRIASLPAQGNLTAFGSGVGVGQVISVQAITNGELRYTNAGIEATPFASFTFQVQDDGDLSDGGSNLDPTPNTFTLFFDDQRVDFVRNLYQDILERDAETGGLTNWLNQMVSGTPNSQIVSALWNTFEHRAIQVDGYYQQFLGRAPDPGGRDFWINRMLSGMDESDVMSEFMATAEYQLNNAANDAFLAAVYQDLFNRAPDANGQEFWLNELSSGRMTRATVADALVNTRERYLGLVFNYYDDFYSRLPDSQGVEFWVSQLTGNVLDDRAVAEALLVTTEYLNQDA